MTLRHEMAWLALLIGSIVSVRAANANAHTVPGHPRSARDSAARDEMYAAVRAYVAAERIPAFAAPRIDVQGALPPALNFGKYLPNRRARLPLKCKETGNVGSSISQPRV